MEIKILGGGCKNCHKLKENTIKALELLDIDAQVQDVTEYSDIASYGVMSTPALVIDEEVALYGKVSSPTELEEIIRGYIH